MSPTNDTKNVLLLFSASWVDEPYQLTELEEFKILSANLAFTRRSRAEIMADEALSPKELSTVMELLQSGKFNAIVADSAEVVVIQAHLHKLGLPRIPALVISTESNFRGLEAFGALVSSGAGDDPVADLVRAHDALWSSSSRGHYEAHLAYGIPADRVVHLPFCTFLRNLCNPASRQWHTRTDLVDADAVARVEGRVLASGIFNRDFVTFLRACSSFEERPAILTDVTRLHQALPEDEIRRFQLELEGTAGVECLYASPHTYIACLRAAAVVVVPLFDPDFTSGHFTFADAQALGRPVVATDYPTARDFIEDGTSGLLYAPRDVESLREQLRRLAGDPALAQAVAAGGQRAEARLSEAARGVFLATLRRLTAA